MSYGKRFGRAAVLSLEEVEQEIEAAAAAAAPAATDEVVDAPEGEAAVAVVDGEAVATDATPEGEAAADAAVDAEPEVLEVEDVADMEELDGESEEIEAGADETEETVEDATSATDDAENLEAVANQLEGTLEDGGALPQTIAVAEVAVESYIKNLTGRKPTKRVLLSLESFGGINQRQQATRLAIENIREWAGKAWAAIVQMFKKAMGFLKGLVDKFVGGFVALKNKVKSMRDAAKAGKAKIDKFGPELSLPRRVWVNLQLGGKFSKEAFFKGIESTKKFMARILAWFKIGKKSIADAKVGDELKAAAGEGGGEMGASIDSKPLATATAAMGKQSSAEDGCVTVTYMEELVGGATAEITGPDVVEVEGQKMKAGATMDVNISMGAAEAEAADDLKVRSFTAVEIDKALDGIDSVIVGAEELAAASAATVAVQAQILKEAEAAAKVDGEKKGSTFRRATSAAQGFFSRAARSLAKPLAATIRFVRFAIGAFINLLGTALVLMGVGAAAVGQVGRVAGAKLATAA